MERAAALAPRVHDAILSGRAPAERHPFSGGNIPTAKDLRDRKEILSGNPLMRPT
jgi:hypothetical protein